MQCCQVRASNARTTVLILISVNNHMHMPCMYSSQLHSAALFKHWVVQQQQVQRELTASSSVLVLTIKVLLLDAGCTAYRFCNKQAGCGSGCKAYAAKYPQGR